MSAMDQMVPASAVVAITPHASTNITKHPTRSVYVGGGGDVDAVFEDDSTFLFKNVAAGTTLPICVKRINAAATTATYLGAMY